MTNIIACQENSEKSKHLWNQAVTDTEKELKEAEIQKANIESRIVNLRMALRTYKGNRDRGLPWPGLSPATQT
jgi:hypothetical protein